MKETFSTERAHVYTFVFRGAGSFGKGRSSVRDAIQAHLLFCVGESSTKENDWSESTFL